MKLLQARKGKGIDDLLNSLSPALPEEISTTISQASSSTRLQRAIQKYEQILDLYKRTVAVGAEWGAYSQELEDVLPRVREYLTSYELSAFVMKGVEYEFEKGYYRDTFGRFCSRLIQNGYRKGENDFILNTTALTIPLWRVGKLHGKKENPLNIFVRGNFGNWLGSGFRYVDVVIEGNLELPLAREAKHSSFTIHGEIINLTKAIPYIKECYKCSFKASYQETTDYLLKYVRRGNRIYRIEHDRSEILLRDYGDAPAE